MSDYRNKLTAILGEPQLLLQRLEQLISVPTTLDLAELEAIDALLRGNVPRSSNEDEEVRVRVAAEMEGVKARMPYAAVAINKNVRSRLSAAVAKATPEELDRVGILRTADFGGRVVHLLFRERHQSLWTGLVAGLAEEHPIRRRIDEEGFYEGHDSEPSLILGGGDSLLNFYRVRDVLKYTESWARPQREAARQRRLDEEREREAREESWQQSEAGRRAADRAADRERIAELERDRAADRERIAALEAKVANGPAAR